MSRKKKKCEEKSCLWKKDHPGAHALRCKTCAGKGIVFHRDNWNPCLICGGRGWRDVKRKKRKENEQRA